MTGTQIALLCLLLPLLALAVCGVFALVLSSMISKGEETNGR